MKLVLFSFALMLVLSPISFMAPVSGRANEERLRDTVIFQPWASEWGNCEDTLQASTDLHENRGVIVNRIRVGGISHLIGAVVDSNGTLYTTTGEGYLMAVDPFAGLLWRSEEPLGERLSTPSMDSMGNLYFVVDGYLTSYTPEGVERWRVNTTSNVAFNTAPTVALNEASTLEMEMECSSA